MKAEDRNRLRIEVDFEDRYGGPGGVVPLISIDHPRLTEHRAGVLWEASPRIAAKMVFNQTHREASEQEHARYKEELAARTAEYEQIELNKRMREGKFAVLQVPQPVAQTAAPSESVSAPVEHGKRSKQ